VGSVETLRSLAEPVLADAGLETWDVEAGRGVLRFLVDAPGGVDLDTLTRASVIVSELVDGHPELAPDGSYQLEVSSPGVERILRTPEHFRRYIGAEVNVKTSVPVGGARRHTGRLTSTGPEGIEIQPAEGPEGEHLGIRFEEIDRARTVLVWGPTAAPTARGRGRNERAHSAAPRAALDAKDAS